MIQVCFVIIAFLSTIYAFKGLRNSGYALTLIWSMYALEQFLQSVNPIFITYGSLVNIGVVGIAAVCLLNGVQSGKIKKLRLSKAHFWWGSLICLAAISLFWSVSLSTSWGKFKLSLPYILGFCVVAPFCAHDRKQIDNAINSSVFLGGSILFGMLFCNFSARFIVLATDTNDELLANPLAVATYSGYILICSAFSMYAQRNNTILNLLRVIICGIAVYLIVRSGSRGQLVAAVLVCMIWIPLTARVTLKRSTIISMLFGFVILVAASYFLVANEQNAWRWKSERLRTDQFGRLEMAGSLLQANLDAGPWAWFMGLGNSSSFSVLGTYPHVVPAEILAEEGLLGFWLFASFLIVVGSIGWRVMNSNALDTASRVNMGAMLALFSFQLILSFKQGTLLGQTSLFGLGLCISLAAERAIAARRRSLNFSREAELFQKSLLSGPFKADHMYRQQ